MLYTSGSGSDVVRLSGLLALPRGVAPRRLVSFQHGTATTRTAVPSQPDGTGIAAAVVFAGNGYALIAPDYPGMGESPGRHPYYIADSIGPAVADMIAASQRVKGVPSAPVFLSGFSEGGRASRHCAFSRAEGNTSSGRRRLRALTTFGECRCQQR